MIMQDKGWVVVTGASSGIGLKAAELLVSDGYSVIATARNKDKLDELFRNTGGQVRCLPWDLSEMDTIKEYADTVHKEIGQITGLVHCAGIQKTTPIHLNKHKDMLEIFQINTFAAMLLISNFSRKDFYLKNKTSFVLISSLAAHEGAFGKSLYGASKGALEGFIKPAAAELTEKGVRINAIAPGVIKTEMVEAYFRQLSDDQIEKTESDYPLGFGESLDAASLIEFLLSEKSKWNTGQVITLDGGHLSRKV
jgi:NAD(P)-dependent dehydrogenase (short-subunit alcohol dehydrogenase family)